MKTVAVAVLLFMAGASGAQEVFSDGATLSCEDKTLSGPYALAITGTRPAPVVLPIYAGIAPGTIEQVIGAFIITFDGHGSLSLADDITVKGALSGLYPTKGGTGTYKINPDCTGSFTVNLPQLPKPLVNNFVLTDGGQGFRSVVVAPQPIMVSVTARKVEARHAGSWRP